MCLCVCLCGCVCSRETGREQREEPSRFDRVVHCPFLSLPCGRWHVDGRGASRSTAHTGGKERPFPRLAHCHNARGPTAAKVSKQQKKRAKKGNGSLSLSLFLPPFPFPSLSLPLAPATLTPHSSHTVLILFLDCFAQITPPLLFPAQQQRTSRCVLAGNVYLPAVLHHCPPSSLSPPTLPLSPAFPSSFADLLPRPWRLCR